MLEKAKNPTSNDRQSYICDCKSKKKPIVGQIYYLEQRNMDEVEMVRSRQDGSELRQNRLIFYAILLLGTAPLSILLLTMVV